MKDSTTLEYWETHDARRGGVIVDINENRLWVRSPVDMHIGAELGISVYFSHGFEFDGFQVLARTAGKDLGCQEGWEVYEYELEFIGISEPDLLRLRNFLKIRQRKSTYS